MLLNCLLVLVCDRKRHFAEMNFNEWLAKDENFCNKFHIEDIKKFDEICPEYLKKIKQDFFIFKILLYPNSLFPILNFN